MFRTINNWLGQHTGYRVSRATPRGLPQEFVSDPRVAAYHDPGPGHGCSIVAPTNLGIGFNAFSLEPGSYHPWIVAVRALEVGSKGHTFHSVLKQYYSIVKPAILSEWLDIPEHSCPQLAILPLHAWSLLPWTVRSAEEVIRAVEVAQLEENRLSGLDEGISAGAKAYGPVSDEKLRIEADRITRLFESIKENGFDYGRSDYNLRATFLVSGAKWSWISMGGMHRVALAAAAGVSGIPVRVAAVVRREEVDIWPQVAAGLYDRETALGLFDRLIDLQPPKCVLPWISWVDSSQLS